MMYNPLFVFLQSQKWYTFGLQFGILMRYYLQYNLAHMMMKGYDPLNGQEYITALKALPKVEVTLQRKYNRQGNEVSPEAHL